MGHAKIPTGKYVRALMTCMSSNMGYLGARFDTSHDIMFSVNALAVSFYHLEKSLERSGSENLRSFDLA